MPIVRDSVTVGPLAMRIEVSLDDITSGVLQSGDLSTTHPDGVPERDVNVYLSIRTVYILMNYA